MMNWLFAVRHSALPFGLAGFVCLVTPSFAPAADKMFPFDHQLLLDARPMPGSKRLPGLQVSEGGAADIDLWCASGKGQVVIAENSFTIVPVSMEKNQCSAEKLQQDEALMQQLSDVTTWRRDGDAVVLSGPKTLRFRMSTN